MSQGYNQAYLECGLFYSTNDVPSYDGKIFHLSDSKTFWKKGRGEKLILNR